MEQVKKNTLSFTKMHGLGNDFVVIDDLNPKPATQGTLSSSLARQICDRRFGIGADQILWLRKPQNPKLDVRMEILNSDGSTAEMCGNGIRAVALYLHRYGPHRRLEYQVETLAGVKTVQIHGDHVAVDMGKPTLMAMGESIVIENQKLCFYEVSMGNPHAVFFVEKVSTFPVEKLGPLIECHPRFPRRTNVEFIEILDSHSIQVRVWERGAGITLACGTGACAAAVASLATQRVKGPVCVELPGGKLQITWEGPGTSVVMEGPAQEVFQGEFLIPPASF